MLAGMTAGCTVPGEKTLTADDVADRYLEHWADLRDYSASVRVTGENVSTERSVVQVKMPCRYSVEYLDSAGLPVLIEAFNGSTLEQYHPATRTVEEVPATGETCTRFAREDFQQVVYRIVSENTITYFGVEGVNGSRAHVVEAAPDDPFRYTDREFARMRAWIDTSTWMVDRVDFSDDSGEIVLSAEYTNIAVNPGIPDSAFTLAPLQETEESPSVIPVTFPI
jgi:outer membrane lipoprotein-sorting protein